MSLTHTISLLEVLWTIAITIGIFFAYRSRNKVKGDLVSLKHRKDYIVNGPREILAEIRIRTENVKVGTLCGFFLIGINAMRYPPPAGHNANNFASVLTATVFICAAVAMIIDTHMYLRDRDRIIAQIGQGPIT